MGFQLKPRDKVRPAHERGLDRALFDRDGDDTPVEVRWRLLMDWVKDRLGTKGMSSEVSKGRIVSVAPDWHYGRHFPGVTEPRNYERFPKNCKLLGWFISSWKFSPYIGGADDVMAEAKRLCFEVEGPIYQYSAAGWLEEGKKIPDDYPWIDDEGEPIPHGVYSVYVGHTVKEGWWDLGNHWTEGLNNSMRADR